MPPNPPTTYTLPPSWSLQLPVESSWSPRPFPGDCLLLTWTPLSPHSTGGHCWLMRGLGEPFLHISPQSRTKAREGVTEHVSSCHARQCVLCLEQGFSTFALLTLWARKVFGVGTVLGHAWCLEATRPLLAQSQQHTPSGCDNPKYPRHPPWGSKIVLG